MCMTYACGDDIAVARKILIEMFSDVLGRILGRPGELESGIMTALIGAPCFIWVIRKVKVNSL